MKYLIISADDFGLSSIFNEKILELLHDGKITSTTIMVKRFAEEQRSQILRLQKLERTDNISVGLHLEFEPGQYESQIEDQLKKFEEIFEKKPSHLDIHKSASFLGAYDVVTGYSKKFGIPCRNWGQGTENARSTSEKFLLATVGFGPIKNFNDIKNWLKTLVDEKYHEIAFHPGTYDSSCKSSLNKDREKDVENILKLNKILAKYEAKKVSFHDVPI